MIVFNNYDYFEFTNCTVETRLTSYQVEGIKKMLELWKQLEQMIGQERPYADHVSRIKAITSIFCEHQLADTNYIAIQEQSWRSNGKISYKEAELSTVLKAFTYILFTNRTLEGFFLTKVKDHTLQELFGRVEEIIHTPSMN